MPLRRCGVAHVQQQFRQTSAGGGVGGIVRQHLFQGRQLTTPLAGSVGQPIHQQGIVRQGFHISGFQRQVALQQRSGSIRTPLGFFLPSLVAQLAGQTLFLPGMLEHGAGDHQGHDGPQTEDESEIQLVRHGARPPGPGWPGR